MLSNIPRLNTGSLIRKCLINGHVLRELGKGTKEEMRDGGIVFDNISKDGSSDRSFIIEFKILRTGIKIPLRAGLLTLDDVKPNPNPSINLSNKSCNSHAKIIHANLF